MHSGNTREPQSPLRSVPDREPLTDKCYVWSQMKSICGLLDAKLTHQRNPFLKHIQFIIREYVPIETGEIPSGHGRLQEIYFCEESFDGLQGRAIGKTLSQCAREERSGRL